MSLVSGINRFDVREKQTLVYVVKQRSFFEKMFTKLGIV